MALKWGVVALTQESRLGSLLGKFSSGKQSDYRLLFFVSIFFTGRLILKSAETAPAELEIPTRGTTERKETPVEPVAAPGPEHNNSPTQRTGA
jgi:hypothetical protein